jgi:hypothetical protein
VQIREREMIDLFDLALVVVRRRPLAIAAASLAGVAPFAALNAGVAATWPSLPWLGLLLIVFEAPLATAPLTVVLGGLMFGDRPRPGQVASAIARRAFALAFFAGLLRALMLGTLVLIPFLLERLSFVDEVILLENCPAGKVMKRGAALGRGFTGESMARAILQIALGGMFMVSAWWSASKLAEALFDELTLEALPQGPYSWAVLHAAAWTAVAFFGVVRFLAYLDQRIKLEGWAVELRLRAAGAALEDTRRW